jgi:hypothetical protein
MLCSLRPSTNALPAPLWTCCVVQEGHSGVICWMMVANPCGNSPSFWILVLGWLPYPVTRCWFPNQSSSAPIISSYVAPLGAPCRTPEA